jgi:hypothetical protein
MRAYLRGIWRYIFATAILLTVAPFLHPLAAQDLSGAGLPEFRAALAQWLEGEEEAALAAFRDLAHVQNLAAQTMLAIIDKSGHLQGPYINSLPRTERIALLRADGGISGRSWIHAAAEGSHLAQSLNALWTGAGDKTLAQEFAMAGEDRAARATLLVVAARQEKGFSEAFRAQDWYPASLLHLAGPYLPDNLSTDRLHPGHPVRGMLGQPVTDGALADWLEQTPLARPLRGACARQCPGDVTSCTQALYHALDSYHALLKLGSPLASLVPEEEFAQSRRSAEALARRIMLNHTARTREAMHIRIAEIDSCAATWLAEEAARYTPRPRMPVMKN